MLLPHHIGAVDGREGESRQQEEEGHVRVALRVEVQRAPAAEAEEVVEDTDMQRHQAAQSAVPHHVEPSCC